MIYVDVKLLSGQDSTQDLSQVLEAPFTLTL